MIVVLLLSQICIRPARRSARSSVDWQLRNFLASSSCGIFRVVPHLILCLLTHRIGFLLLSQICLSPASLSVGPQLHPFLASSTSGLSSVFQLLILCSSSSSSRSIPVFQHSIMCFLTHNKLGQPLQATGAGFSSW
jgi:hypothetical protein